MIIVPDRHTYIHTSDLVINSKNKSILGTLFVFIRAKSRDSRIVGLRDFLNSSIL